MKLSPESTIRKLSVKLVHNTNSSLELCIPANGVEDSEMEKESKFGWMVRSIQDIGRTIRLMEREHSGILMVILMKEIG